MRFSIFIFLLFIANVTVMATEQSLEEKQLSEQKLNDLNDTLKDTRAVPYMENGQIKGYVI